MPLTQEQFSNLRSQGLSVEQIVAFEAGNTPAPAPQPQKSLLRTIVEDPVKTLVVKPAVRFGQAAGSLVAGALGVSPEKLQETARKDVTIGGITIEGQKPMFEGGASQILGDAAKATSYLYTGGTTVGLKPFVKTGAVSGGLYSFGDSVQKAEATPASVAYNTMFGTATGAAFGLVTYGLVNGISKALELKSTLNGKGDITQINTKLNELNQEVFKPTKTQLKNAGKHDPINTYTEIFGTKLPQVDKNNRFLNESALDFASQVDGVYRPASEAFNTILRNSPEVISLSKARQTALSNVSKASLTPNAKIAARNRVNSEFDALLSEARSKGWLRGDDNLPVEFADNFKDVFWSATRNFGSEEASITNAVNKEIGFSFKNAIEGAVKDVNVQRYNEKLGDLITLRDFLEGIGGKQAGTGGKMTRLLAGRVAGTIAGSAGGVPGAIAGNITGDILARVLIDPAMQPYRWIINKRLSQLPRAEVLKLEEEANKIIQQMFQNRIKRLALPPPTPLGTTGNPIITPAPTTFEAGVPRGGGQRLSSQSPITQPTINTTKSDIPTTLGQKPNPVKKSNPQAGFIQAYKGESDLTTKILKDLEGKTTVSKQYILDATNRGELKQVERDLIRDMVQGEGDTINVSDFAKKVKAELLPLKVESKSFAKKGVDGMYTSGSTRYESITLPDDIRGKVSNYKENIYESPIATSAGETHFPGKAKNYFGHTRIEDMADNKTRRVIEVQSDLYQKGNLEREMPYMLKDIKGGEQNAMTKAKSVREAELSKLQQYNDPTAHFRMVREEIKKASQDGKTKLQFPTGETALRIEGLVDTEMWNRGSKKASMEIGIQKLEDKHLRIGEIVNDGNTDWIVSNKLGEGKFKALPKDAVVSDLKKSFPNISEKEINDFIILCL